MKRWWLVIVLLLSLGINAGILAALAVGKFQGRVEPRRSPVPFEGPMHDARNLARGVGLDTEGSARFRELHREFFETAREQRRNSMGLRRELLSEVTADDPDRDEIEAILRRISESELEMERALVDTMLDARDILDENQEKRYLHFLGSRLMKMDRMDRIDHGPPGGRGRPAGPHGSRERHRPGGRGLGQY